MSFATLEYAVLLTSVFVLYWALGRRPGARLVLLFVASYVFYGWWRWSFLLLIAGSTLMDWGLGLVLARQRPQAERRRWLWVSVAGNLGLLGLYKYFDFLSGSVTTLLRALGWRRAPALRLGLTLPPGVSFYTFQSMSYTIDIYRGELQPTANPLLFAVFVAFFPQLVAGPIVRARYFLPQLEVDPSLDEQTATRGLLLLAIGLFKKLVLADLLALNLVDRVFESPALYTSAELLLGVYGYALQIYCDFSAYSDLAIGSALLLGLQLPPNFNQPYRACDLRDFWRRWHISLSTWLRDYLYVPLGGSRGGPLATYRNLLITMTLGGLWHGAAWTFVLWGALHGLGLAVTRAWQRWRGERPATPLRRLLSTVGTFHFVCLGWVLFRAGDLGQVGALLRGLARATPGTANVTPLVWACLGAGLATQLVPVRALEPTARRLAALPAYAQAALLAAVILGCRALGTTEVAPFIYFQF